MLRLQGVNSESLGFESDGLKELARAAGGRFIRCIYDPAVQQPLVRQFLKWYLNQLRSAFAAQDETGSIQTITGEALDQLNQLATYFKDQAFMEEDEWRLILPYFEARTKVKYRGGRSLVTPYIELPITLPDGRVPLKQIGLGPAPHHRLDGAAVVRMCNDNGIYPSACAYSAAPYRAW